MKSLFVNTRINNTAFSMSSGIADIDNALVNGGWQSQTINEVVSTNNLAEQLDILIPTLSTLSRQGRWIVLVGAPKKGLKALLSRHGIDSARVLLVHPKDQLDALWAMEQALMCGNSSAVLGWPGQINERDLKRLQLATKRTNALTFLFKATGNRQPKIKVNCYSQTLSQQQVSITRREGSLH